MATMISCPACKKEISVEATACPKCGQPITDEIRTAGQKKSTKSVKWGRTVLVIILWGAIISYFVKDKDKNDAPTPSQAVNVPAFSLTATQFVNNVNNHVKKLYNDDDTKKMLIENNITLSAYTTRTNDDETKVVLNDIGEVIIHTNRKGMVTAITCMFTDPNEETRYFLRYVACMTSVMAGIKPDWSLKKLAGTLETLIIHFVTNKRTGSITIDGIIFQIVFYKLKDGEIVEVVRMSRPE